MAKKKFDDKKFKAELKIIEQMTALIQEAAINGLEQNADFLKTYSGDEIFNLIDSACVRMKNSIADDWDAGKYHSVNASTRSIRASEFYDDEYEDWDEESMLRRGEEIYDAYGPDVDTYDLSEYDAECYYEYKRSIGE